MYLYLIHVVVQQKSTQRNQSIIFQLKINFKKQHHSQRYQSPVTSQILMLHISPYTVLYVNYVSIKMEEYFKVKNNRQSQELNLCLHVMGTRLSCFASKKRV